jgi:uncharacterized repeat protein (TIGR01451 family)
MNKKWSITFLLIGLSLALWATTTTRALEITIDEFSTDQATLTLTYPADLGLTAESVVSGAGILGGERDIQVELIGGAVGGNSVSAGVATDYFSYGQDPTLTASGLLQWDGPDGDATTLDPLGLGGIDLTSGGVQDTFVIGVFYDDTPIDLTLEVFTNAGNSSTYDVVLPGGIWTFEEWVIPFDAFVVNLGAGADFTNVGAITLFMTSATAPDLVIDYVRTSAVIETSKRDALFVDNNSNGQANPGDVLEYTIVISNLVGPIGSAATGVTFSDTPDPNTTLVVPSVTTTQGTITSGDTPGDTTVAVNIGDVVDGATVTITFQVEVNDPLPGCVAQVSNQGFFDSTTLSGLPTDDPDTPAIDDATDTPTFCLYDWGDAPDPTYPTLLANNGARHVLDGYTYLGAGVDAEADGQPDATATGDDADGNDDEDGVVFTSGLYPGATANIDVTANQSCTLSAWVDFNIDGDWGEPDEDLFPGGQMVIPGVNSLSFPVPAGATMGTTYARFRCFAVGALSPTGEASNGEVEDYEVEILALLSLGDLVWYDTNQDGIQDGGEPGVQNIAVDLYDTADCSGMPINTDTTDASGLYGYTDLPPATYCLQFSNIPAGWTISPQDQGADDSVDSDADPATGQITNINLAADDPDEDVGLYAVGSIGDTVWCDLDSNNAYDAGEGVPGVTVDLYEDTNCDTLPDGAPIATQDTVGDGQYTFTGLSVGPPGDPVCYVVQVDEADMGACNNPITPVEYDVPLDADNPDDLDDDFGFNQLISLGDYVWYDTDQDGLQDGGEPGVAGIDVTLYDNADCTGNVVGTDTTDASGLYGFTGLTPGTYCLQFSNIPAGWSITLQNQGADDSLDSDADPATAQITNIVLNATDLDEDMGLYVPGSIGDTVWCDVDGDNAYDAGEGVAGVTISLYEDTNCDTAPDGAAIDTQDTVGDGQYLFTDLPVGPPGGPAVCYVVQVDQADMGACNNPITPVEYDVPLDADNPDDLDDDFGFNQQQLASIGDYVWWDINQDGLQDGGESGLAGITVNLYECASPGVPTDATGTDASGSYGFMDLVPGDYFVECVLPSGYTFSPQDQGGDDTVDSDADPTTGQMACTTLAPGENDPTWDCGMFVTGPAIQLDKTVSLDVIAPNGPAVDYTLTITNVGDMLLNPVHVVDVLDVGLTFIPGSATPVETSVVGQVITWDDVTSGAGLAPGGSTQITFQAAVTTTIGTYVNHAVAAGTHATGVVTDDDDVPVVVADPSVALSKDILAPGAVDGYITFTIHLSNTGPSVIEVLPLYDSFTGDIIYYDGDPVADAIDNVNGTLTWNDLTTYFGDMAPGQSFVVETVFQITSSGETFSATNVARVSNGIDEYGNPANDDQDRVDIVDMPTAVELLYFRASQRGQAVWLSWETASEVGSYGFRLLRSHTGALAQAVEMAFVPAQGNAGGAGYSLVDRDVVARQTYTYWLAEVDVHGIETVHAPRAVTLTAPSGSSGLTLFLPLIAKP